MLGLRNVSKRLKAAVWPRLMRRLPFGVQVSHSQFGEDMLLSWLFRHFQDRPGFLRGYRMYHIGWDGLVPLERWRPELPIQFNALFTKRQQLPPGLVVKA